jgi:hypothetical protein
MFRYLSFVRTSIGLESIQIRRNSMGKIDDSAGQSPVRRRIIVPTAAAIN